MDNIAVTRIKREFKEVVKAEQTLNDRIHIELVNDNYLDLLGQIAGPPDTPYEGATFLLDVKIPDSYPFQPPKIKFISKIWHPNISSVTGAICLDILKDQWAAAMNLRVVLLSIQALLSSPEPDDPQDAVVAKQYKNDPEMFRLTAKHWAHIYAHAPNDEHPEFVEYVQRLKDMGIDEDQARLALSASSWDISKAMDHIFN